MAWLLTRDGDPKFLALADRHYSREKPGTALAVGPGRKLVLVTEDGQAMWATRHAQYRADGLEGWECNYFRNEGPWLSSHLIVLALGIHRYVWGDPPEAGMFTFIGPHLRGGCFHAAGFRREAVKPDGKTLLRLDAERFPPPLAPEIHTLFEDHPVAVSTIRAERG